MHNAQNNLILKNKIEKKLKNKKKIGLVKSKIEKKN
jgi:hypothetical protein